jgi:hypothetical protein
MSMQDNDFYKIILHKNPLLFVTCFLQQQDQQLNLTRRLTAKQSNEKKSNDLLYEQIVNYVYRNASLVYMKTEKLFMRMSKHYPAIVLISKNAG